MTDALAERIWSDDVRVLFRPLRTYRDLAAAYRDVDGTVALGLRRPLLYLTLIGGFVALSAAGRLYAPHVLYTIAFWSFVPAWQIGGVLLVRLLFARRVPMSVAVDLHFTGQAPWLLLLLTLVGICLFSPAVYDTFGTLLATGVLPWTLLATMIWSTWLTVVGFWRGLELSWPKALLAAVAYYAVYGGIIVGYFLYTHQLQPLLVRATT